MVESKLLLRPHATPHLLLWQEADHSSLTGLQFPHICVSQCQLLLQGDNWSCENNKSSTAIVCPGYELIRKFIVVSPVSLPSVSSTLAAVDPSRTSTRAREIFQLRHHHMICLTKLSMLFVGNNVIQGAAVTEGIHLTWGVKRGGDVPFGVTFLFWIIFMWKLFVTTCHLKIISPSKWQQYYRYHQFWVVIYHPAPKLSAVAYPSRRKSWLPSVESGYATPKPLCWTSRRMTVASDGEAASLPPIFALPRLSLHHFGKRQLSKTRWGLNLTWDCSAKCCMLFGFTVPNQVFDDFCCITFSHEKCFGLGGTQPFDKDGYLSE